MLCAVQSPSTVFSQFNLDHWMKVKAERSRLGLARDPQRGPQEAHPLLGKSVVDTRTGQRYLVERVSRDWFKGWFLVALMQCNGSHRTCVVSNLSCHDEGVLNQLADFKTHFQTLS